MKRKKYIWNVLKSIILTIIIVFVLNTWFFKAVEVVGNSMYPTLKNGQQGFSSVISLNTDGINRFDVVVVKTKYEFIVKRIIGLPYEKLEIKEDVLYINDEVVDQDFLDEKYINEVKQSYQYFTNDFGPVRLGADEYFVMGDNRQVSIDSRYSQYGAFHKSDIVSKYVVVLLPIDQVNLITDNK